MIRFSDLPTDGASTARLLAQAVLGGDISVLNASLSGDVAIPVIDAQTLCTDSITSAAFSGVTEGNAVLDIDFIPETEAATIRFCLATRILPLNPGALFNSTVGIWVNGSEIRANTAATADLGTSDASVPTALTNDITLALDMVVEVKPGVLNSIRIEVVGTDDTTNRSGLIMDGTA